MGEKTKTVTSKVAQCVTLTAVGLPLISWLFSGVAGLNLRYVVVAAAIVCGLLFALNAYSKPSSNQFLGSGRTPPLEYARELILKKKGGKSTNAYWCDPSIAFGHISDFQCTQGPRIDFKELLREKGEVIGPYCVDDENRSIVFVETSADLDPAEVGPFYFQTQRDNATRVYVVPFDEYNRVCAELDAEMSSTDRLLLVYNTARCGSTLLSKCLDQLSQTRSISEPDVLTSLTHMASEANGTRDADIVALAGSSCKLLCYLRRRRYPECETVCIKLRFQMVYIADLVHKAVPDAKSIFLYRNGLDVIDSMGAAFINTGIYRAIRKIGLDVFYVFHISTLPQNLPKLMPLMNDTTRFPQSCYRPLGAVCPFVLSWISVMHYGMNAYRGGFVHAAIRYEDLILGRAELVAKMMGQIGLLPQKAATGAKEDCTRLKSRQADEVFKKDVHAGGVTQSSRTIFDEDTGKIVRRGFAYLRGDDADVISAVLAHHDEIDHSDFVIPGTITL